MENNNPAMFQSPPTRWLNLRVHTFSSYVAHIFPGKSYGFARQAPSHAKPHRAASRDWHPAAVPRRSRGPGDLLPEALATGDEDFTNMKRVDLLGLMVDLLGLMVV